MFKENTRHMELDLGFTGEEKARLLRIARESVDAVVEGSKYTPVRPSEPRLLQNAGAFVTLHSHGELRGCIGLIEARFPIYVTVAQMAAKAATADPRFESVSRPEVGDLDIEISVLSPLVKIEDPEDLIVGKHGVVIEKGFYRGLLLPQVATENGWDRGEFLKYVSMKAGLSKEAYLDHDSRIFVFTAEVFAEGKSAPEEEKGVAERT